MWSYVQCAELLNDSVAGPLTDDQAQAHSVDEHLRGLCFVDIQVVRKTYPITVVIIFKRHKVQGRNIHRLWVWFWRQRVLVYSSYRPSKKEYDVHAATELNNWSNEGLKTQSSVTFDANCFLGQIRLRNWIGNGGSKTAGKRSQIRSGKYMRRCSWAVR